MTTTKKDVFVERFGTLESFRIARTQKGPFAIFEIACKGFVQPGVTFNGKVIEEMKAAGTGSSIWIKGPVQAREYTKSEGDERNVSATSIKAIYFRKREPRRDDLTAVRGIGAKVAERINAAGILTWSQLAGLSDRAFASLDADVSAIKGSLIRNRARESARALIEEQRDARLERDNVFA